MTRTLPVAYEPHELDELTLAYACTIHRAQGSEYPCVVIPLVTQHYLLLQRNLLYTAITRARNSASSSAIPRPATRRRERRPRRAQHRPRRAPAGPAARRAGNW